MKRVFVMLLMVALSALAPASAEDSAVALEFAQRLDAPAALQVPLRDETGRVVRFGEYFGVVPVVLVLGYFRCPNLCGTLLDGVLESLAQADLAPASYRLLAVSIDPRDDPAAALRRRRAFRTALGAVEAHFLTGETAFTARLAGSVGFPYTWDAAQGQYRHPAGFVVLTPDGRIARYFLGVRFDARDLRRAIDQASAGRIGSPVDRLLRPCSGLDPGTGRYTRPVMTVVRAVSVGLATVVGAWVCHPRSGKRP